MLELVKNVEIKVSKIIVNSYFELLKEIQSGTLPYKIFLGNNIKSLKGLFSFLNLELIPGAKNKNYFDGLNEWDVEDITDISLLFKNINVEDIIYEIDISEWKPTNLLYSYEWLDNSKSIKLINFDNSFLDNKIKNLNEVSYGFDNVDWRFKD